MFMMLIRHLSRDVQVWSCEIKKQPFRVIFIIICDNWLSQLFLSPIIKNLNSRLGKTEETALLRVFSLKAYFCQHLIHITMMLNCVTATLKDR